MPGINSFDGRYALDYWLDENSDDEPDSTDYADNVEELRNSAEKIINAGRYRYIVLSRWNPSEDDWDEIDVWSADERE
jgi:hypothetical protein